MADFDIENKYEIASNAITGADSLLGCMDLQSLGMNQMTLKNMDNTSVPVAAKGSFCDIGSSRYRLKSADTAAQFISNESGSVFVPASNAPENTNLAICMMVTGEGKATFALKVPVNVVYEPEYCGFYESGTMFRVFGYCRRIGSEFPKDYKWIIPKDFNLYAKFSIYSDGLNIDIRKIIGAYQQGIVANPISNYAVTSGDAITGIIPVSIPINYPCLLFVWLTHASSPVLPLSPEYGPSSSRFIWLQRQHPDGSWVNVGRPARIDGLNPTYNNKSVYIPVTVPGTYRLMCQSGSSEVYAGGSQSGPTYTTERGGIGRISASVVGVFGSKVDY